MQPLEQFLAIQEGLGMNVDLDKYSKIVAAKDVALADIKIEVANIFGDINPASAPQLDEVIYSNYGLRLPTTGKGKPSCSEANLKTLEGVIPELALVREHNSAKRAVSSLKGLLRFVDPTDHRFHPTFEIENESGAKRLYAKEPNITGLPMEAREAIVPNDGKKFVYVDWSGAELAQFALMAGQQDLLDAYYSGKDLITYIGEEVFDQAGLDRDSQKTVVYAACYGSDGAAVSATSNLSYEEAQGYIKMFWSRFTNLRDLRDECYNDVLITGKVTYVDGFVRIVCDVGMIPISTPGQVNEWKRSGFNSVIQSSVAVQMRRVLCQASEVLTPQEERIITQVFDAFLFEIPEDMPIEHFVSRIDTLMRTEVNFRFSYGEGTNWKEAQENIIAKRV